MIRLLRRTILRPLPWNSGGYLHRGNPAVYDQTL